MSYSYRIENEADFSKARVEDVNASYKDLAEVCGNIRRRPAEAAAILLEEAKAGKRPIRYYSHNTGMGHRSELKGQKGRWPMKAAGIVLKCLLSAIANAKEKGLSEDLVVAHACANKKHSHMRYASKGRRGTSKLETARVEIVLRERAESKKNRIALGKKAEVQKKEAGNQRTEAKEASRAAKGAPAAPLMHAETAKAAPAIIENKADEKPKARGNPEARKGREKVE